MVVWLDELDRFLSPDGLDLGLLNQLTSQGAIVVGAIRVHAREVYRLSDKLLPPEWDVLEAFTRIDLKLGLDPTELDWVRQP